MIALLLSRWRTAGLAALCAVAAGLFLLWRFEAGRARALAGQVAAAQAAAQAAERVDQSMAAAAGEARAVASNGAARDARNLAQHGENRDAIQTAPGADQGLDPGLNAAGRRGLCAYQAYRGDPDCLQLRGPHPAGRPPADAPDGPAAP